MPGSQRTAESILYTNTHKAMVIGTHIPARMHTYFTHTHTHKKILWEIFSFYTEGHPKVCILFNTLKKKLISHFPL